VTHNPSQTEDLLRELAPQVLGAVIRKYRDFAIAEDAVQEALIAASTQWPRDGLPDTPYAWLTQVAYRRMTDMLRKQTARRNREYEFILDPALTPDPIAIDPAPQKDDTLILLFMCCHPALTSASAIALTLRAVGGLKTAEIAHAFLVPEATMAQRISRAKQTIKKSGIPFRLPTPNEQSQHLRAVLHVLYLIFNEGYASTAGATLRRDDLASEAIRLTRILTTLQPDNAEATGLLALMVLTDARRLARTTPDGELIPLAQQNRTLWDRQQITEGVALLSTALPKANIGPYQLQAAIAAIHDEAARSEDTDWPQILALYELLRRISENPMVILNQAIAASMVHGPSRGLALLQQLDADPSLHEHHRLYAVRAHLLEMAGDHKAAIEQFQLAASRATSLPERNYLILQAARLSEHTSDPTS
jgi:RNA polymerase sigma factor (sigma-70 family)